MFIELILFQLFYVVENLQNEMLERKAGAFCVHMHAYILPSLSYHCWAAPAGQAPCGIVPNTNEFNLVPALQKKEDASNSRMRMPRGRGCPAGPSAHPICLPPRYSSCLLLSISLAAEWIRDVRQGSHSTDQGLQGGLL